MSMPTEKPADSGVCDWCRELSETLKYCNQCKIARYCSPECQKSHWRKHSEICHAYSNKKSAQSIELSRLVGEIAFHLAMSAQGDMLPFDLYTPIVAKQKKSDTELLIFLEETQDQEEETQEVVPRDVYDQSATSVEESARSWSRMYGIGFGSIVNRAVALAVNTALMLGQLQLTVGGAPVTSMSMYKAESKLPTWTIMRPSDEVPGESTSEPQEREHFWIGFRVQQADSDKVTDDVYFVDFNATAMGIFDTVHYEGGELYAVTGWAGELRRSSPHLYRHGNLFRNQDYLNRWSQMWPEIQNATSAKAIGPNLDTHHRILASKVERINLAIQGVLQPAAK